MLNSVLSVSSRQTGLGVLTATPCCRGHENLVVEETLKLVKWGRSAQTQRQPVRVPVLIVVHFCLCVGLHTSSFGAAAHAYHGPLYYACVRDYSLPFVGRSVPICLHMHMHAPLEILLHTLVSRHKGLGSATCLPRREVVKFVHLRWRTMGTASLLHSPEWRLPVTLSQAGVGSRAPCLNECVLGGRVDEEESSTRLAEMEGL
ncbi:unnamed protein product [Protopolystoma xenopodis]|uniref:Uncharacterized protein n=1 Tax=Protopolystoma xenopodis TaxID=117903 RepID=A0A3S5AQQ0_9PLAT|nr:unnamed protein product [Protopolystoma xenopodis]